jgi:sugar lactone lactonase YvrE
MKTTAFALGLVSLAACGGDSRPTCSDEPGAACTYAGTPGPPGSNDHAVHRLDAFMNQPNDVAISPDNELWISDWNNHIIRKVAADDLMVLMIGNQNEGDGTCPQPCDSPDIYPLGSPPGAVATEVSLNHPTDIDFMPNGDVLLSAWHNNKLRYWEKATGLVKTIAGENYGFKGDGGPAYLAEFNLPKSSVIDADGTIFVVDTRNQRVRKIDPSGVITTIAGIGTAGFSGDGGLATEAELRFDRTGTTADGALALTEQFLYIADTGNHRIRRLDRSTGMIECIAGNGTPSAQGDGANAVDASLNRPYDLEIGPDGRLYIADSASYAIRAIDLATGVIDRVVGTGEPCTAATTCVEPSEGLRADQVRLNKPSGIAFDQDGNMFIADQYNNRIVRIAAGW